MFNLTDTNVIGLLPPQLYVSSVNDKLMRLAAGIVDTSDGIDDDTNASHIT